MYGKLFSSMYEGTLYGHWQALVTFQQMIILCDADGIVDMTPHALAARTSIPLDIIQEGIKLLESPDPYSRTPGDEGRRIELIDSHRPWGWRIINHKHYKYLASAEEKREKDRLRIAAKREAERQDATGCDMSHDVANVAHTDTDTDTDTRIDTSPKATELVFEHWKKIHDKPRAKLDSKRKRLISSALKSYPPEDLFRAIEGYKRSPFHQGKNEHNRKYDSIELIFRDAKHIEDGIALADTKEQIPWQ